MLHCIENIKQNQSTLVCIKVLYKILVNYPLCKLPQDTYTKSQVIEKLGLEYSLLQTIF